MLDYPACVFPVTKVDPVLDQPKGPHQFLNREDEWDYNLCTTYPAFRGFRVRIADSG
jgi:amidase